MSPRSRASEPHILEGDSPMRNSPEPVSGLALKYPSRLMPEDLEAAAAPLVLRLPEDTIRDVETCHSFVQHCLDSGRARSMARQLGTAHWSATAVVPNRRTKLRDS